MSSSQNQAALPKLCLICKDMYGNPVFQDMCSKCFKDFKDSKQPKSQDQLILSQKFLSIEQKHLEEVKKEKELGEQLKTQEKRLVVEVSKPELSGISEKQQEKQKKNTSKCSSCNKKVGILGYECKHCTETFCKFHRLPEQHFCEVNFIEIGKKNFNSKTLLFVLLRYKRFDSPFLIFSIPSQFKSIKRQLIPAKPLQYHVS